MLQEGEKRMLPSGEILVEFHLNCQVRKNKADHITAGTKSGIIRIRPSKFQKNWEYYFQSAFRVFFGSKMAPFIQ